MLAGILGCRGPVLATRGNLNNDIGVPLTLLRLQREHASVVIEMGANHAGEIAYLSRLAAPDVAIINNVGPAHLEGFGDLDGVARAKGEIFQGLGPEGIAVINRDDPYADFWCELARDRRMTGFSLGAAADIRGAILASDGGHTRFRLRSQGGEIDIRLPLCGVHNVRNALAAAAASLAVGAELEDVRRGLESMDAVAGRLQRLAGRQGITVINDAYNANPASLAAALAAVRESATTKWLVLGDMGELGDGAAQLHEQAGHQARGMGFECLYGLGDQSRWAVRAFGAGARHFENREELIQELLEAVARTGEKPLILVKGSRSMRMEIIVQSLVGDPSMSAMGGA
jgi:UDP-N-acetylmuramoyl-tripeptide--D-alanyl-D-alanine ligase